MGGCTAGISRPTACLRRWFSRPARVKPTHPRPSAPMARSTRSAMRLFSPWEGNCAGGSLGLDDSPFDGEIEVLPQVNALHFRIAAERIRPTRAEDFSVVDDVGAVSHHQRLADVVVSHQNSDVR